MEKENGKELTLAKKIDRVVFRVLKVISYISAIALVAVAVICTANVVTTKLFKFGILNATEIVTYLNIPVVFLAIAFIQVERGHTNIDLLSSRFPMVVQKIITVVGYALGAFVCGFIGWRSVTLTITKYTQMAKASAARTSFVIWPFAAIVAFGFLILALSMVWSIVREFTIPKEERCGYMPPPTPAKFDDDEEGVQE